MSLVFPKTPLYNFIKEQITLYKERLYKTMDYYEEYLIKQIRECENTREALDAAIAALISFLEQITRPERLEAPFLDAHQAHS